MTRRWVRALTLLPVIAVLPLPSAAAEVPGSAPVIVMAKKRADKGTLKVVAQGVPQGQSAKITIAGKKYRKKLPRGGKLRNLRPGTYRVWAAPIVADGGTAAVPDLPARIRVKKHKRVVLRLQYTWNPKTDSYPPSPATGLTVVDRGLDHLTFRWVNGQSPDLQSVAIRRKQGSQPPTGLDDGRVVPGDRLATSVTDDGLRSHTTYSYSVFMVDLAGNASRPATLTTRTKGVATQIVAGMRHTCALLGDTGVTTDVGGTAQSTVAECWGANDHGQVGDGSTTDATEAVPVDLPDVVQVAAGGDHTCARQRGGTVYCWGRNDAGQLGSGDTVDALAPVAVDIPNAVDISAGIDHTCAVLTTGGVRCWGANDRGQLGAPPSAFEPLPVTVPGLTSAVSVSAGYAHTCATLTNGSVRCWGANDRGQLGNNSRTDSVTPVRPTTGVVKAVTAGVLHTCALLADGSVSCWGANDYGQLGDGTTTDRTAPTTVALTGAVSLSAGAYHTCATQNTGSVRCWGRNSSGRLGDGTQNDRSSPARVSGVNDALTVVAGGYHSCAVTASGSLCWGFNSSGQLGNGGRTNSLRAVPVSGL